MRPGEYCDRRHPSAGAGGAVPQPVAHATGLTGHMAILEGGEVVLIEKLEAPNFE